MRVGGKWGTYAQNTISGNDRLHRHPSSLTDSEDHLFAISPHITKTVVATMTVFFCLTVISYEIRVCFKEGEFFESFEEAVFDRQTVSLLGGLVDIDLLCARAQPRNTFHLPPPPGLRSTSQESRLTTK